jgi:trehalose/maltose transport system substrate-binding protein
MRSTEPTRREFLARSGGGLAAFSLLGLAACGGSSGSSDEIVFGMTPDHEAIVRPQISRYNQRRGSGPKATIRLYPEDSSQYFDRLRTELQAGTGDLDVFAGDVSWPAQFASNGWIVDLSDRFAAADRKQFLAGAMAANVYKGKVYGVPWFTDCGLLYYRKDLLDKAGYAKPPATWDELKEMAAKITRDAKVKNGVVFTGAIYEGGTVLGTEFIRCAGGDVLARDKVVIASPQALKGLQIQQSLVADGIAPKAVANYKEDENTAAFLRGDAVFMRQWPYAYDFIGDKKQSKLDYSQVGFSRVPVADASIPPTNVGGGWNFYINAGSGNQDAAWTLLQFLAAAPQQKEHALKGSYLPTRTALYKDPDIVGKLPAVKLGGESAEETTTPPVSPYYSDMSLAMSKQFNANVLGSSSPEQVAQTLQDQLSSIVERGG